MRVAMICAGSVAGALAVCGWAPFGWMPLALLSYAVLFWLLQRDAGAGLALSIGLAFGLGLHAAGHGWMFTTLRTKVGLSAPMAVVGTLVFLGYLALFTALPCALTNALMRRRTSARQAVDVLSFAALLTLGEWLRSVLFNGFTSLSIGYVTLDTWLAGFAPIGGMYLSGFVVLLLAGLLGRAVGSTSAALSGTGIGSVILVAGWALGRVDWTQPVGAPLSFRLIQSDVAQARKFDLRYEAEYTRRVADLIMQTPADIVATPETTFTSFLNELPGDLLPRLQQFSQRTGSHVFLGVAMAAANSDGHNSVLQISPDPVSEGLARYDKIRLMPFGEYSPTGFGWFTNLLSIPLKDMSAGPPQQAPLRLAKAGTSVGIGTLICHEDMFGRDAAAWADSANLLLNPTNLAWFDGTMAIDQRLQVARMRSLEVGRPMLRVANTGTTAQIDSHGAVVSEIPAHAQGVLSGSVQAVSGSTPYARAGDAVALTLCGLGLLPALWSARRARPRPGHGERLVSRPATTRHG